MPNPTGLQNKQPLTLPPISLGFSTARYEFTTQPSEPTTSGRNSNGNSARKIETDWRTWLTACGPRTFNRAFADFHAEFWDWYWRITEKRRNGQPLGEEELVFLALWARGFGKSTHAEWAAIAEGALIGSGYVLYVSGTQALADGHVAAIREHLEGEAIASYYPGLADPAIGKHGNQRGWRQDFLQTKNGWAIRPIGLDVGVRGGRVGDQRPTLIIFDDVDSHEDSPLVIEKKLATISRSIIPAGGPDTIILGPQNLIHRNGVFNQIYTRKTSILARRIVSGPHPAFHGLELEHSQTDHGPRWLITGGTPTWPDLDRAACQKFLDDSGREAFLAEYQHDFSAIEQGRVLPEYDERVHVITWSQFAAKFGQARIPEHWQREVGHDVGFTQGHLSAWTWVACAAANSGLAGRMFRYRGRTFSEVSVDDQAEAVRAVLEAAGEWLRPDRHDVAGQPRKNLIQSWQMSHEALSERKTYKAKYGFPFVACKSGKTDGLQQWRHYLRVDRKQPHPFHADEQLPDGTYRLGAPAWFDVVADAQLLEPRDDAGLKIHRQQARDWKYAPDRLSVTGLAETLPFKNEEDTCDSTRMVTARWALNAAPLTYAEKLEQAIPEPYRYETLRQSQPSGEGLTDQAEIAYLEQLERARKTVKRSGVARFDEWGRRIN